MCGKDLGNIKQHALDVYKKGCILVHVSYANSLLASIYLFQYHIKLADTNRICVNGMWIMAQGSLPLFLHK